MTSVVKATCVVDSDDGRCSAVGLDILKKGGNAVDAAVATALCLGVTNIGSSGIGGGAFMLVRMADGTKKGFNMRETAPLLINESMYHDDPKLLFSGPLSIAVPGELKGLYEAWEKFGERKGPHPVIPWKDLVMPAVKFAEEHTISPYLHSQMLKVKSEILADPGLRRVYTSDGKDLWEPGDVCRNEQLAQTLTAIANHPNGADEFYKGETAAKLLRDLRKFGCPITKADLEGYEVEKVVPICTKVSGHEFVTMPPPASGGAGMVLILHILEQYESSKEVEEKVWFHRFIEAVKHTIAVRTHLGDPKFSDIKDVLADMLSESFAKELKEKINDERTYEHPYYYGGRWHIKKAVEAAVIKDHGTSHLSIVDSAGNAVALTSSVNWHYGARYMSLSTGILLNNQMADFTLSSSDTAHPNNHIMPKKRPLSSMGPSILLKDGKLKGVVGSSGGFRIIAGTAQVLLNYFARKMDPLPSIMSPRIFHKFIPNELECENWTTAKEYPFKVTADTRKHLESKGHKLVDVAENNMCQFLVLSDDMKYVTGVSDPRKGSYPAGYIKDK